MKVTTLGFGILVGGLPMILAVSALGQISANQVKQRYERQTKGGNIDEFAQKLDNDDPEKRLEAVKSLGESNDDKAVEYLIQALGDPDLRVKAKSIDALGDMRANDATPVLIQQLFLRDAPPIAKQRILASLGKIGDPRATTPIAEFLKRDLDADTSGTAIYALGEIGSPDSLEVLGGIAETEGNPTLQRLAREAAAKVRYHQTILQTEAKDPLDTFLRPNEPPSQ